MHLMVLLGFGVVLLCLVGEAVVLMVEGLVVVVEDIAVEYSLVVDELAAAVPGRIVERTLAAAAVQDQLVEVEGTLADTVLSVELARRIGLCFELQTASHTMDSLSVE